MFLEWTLVQYVDTEGLVVLLYPAPVIVIMAFSHYLLRYAKKKGSNLLRVTGIITILILILLFTFLAISRINNIIIDHENRILRDKISCSGAYTTTSPEELSKLCNEIQMGGTKEWDWKGFKLYCEDLVEKIREDKYYFDYYDYPENKFGIRNPRNYQDCDDRIYELINFKIFQNSERKIVSEVIDMGGRPEELDPNLCDIYSEMDHELLKKIYVLKINVNEDTIKMRIEDCYKNLATYTGDIEICETLRFPHACYSDVAKGRNNPSICDNIGINYNTNIDEEYIARCKEQAK